MIKIALIGSIVSFLLGFIALITTTILNQIFPKIGYMIFNLSGGSYSADEYKMDFVFANTLATLMIIIGVTVIICISLRRPKNTRNSVHQD